MEDNITFKDIIKKINNINYIKETTKKYSYDDINILYENSKEKKYIRKDKLTYDFLNENIIDIYNLLNDLKDQFNLEGFINKLNYNDIFDIIYRNIYIEEVIIENDENDIIEDNDNNDEIFLVNN